MSSLLRAVTRDEERRGTAIVAALGLVMLAAALLASAAEVAAVSARRARADAAAVTAESAVRRTIAVLLTGWSASYDSLAIGHSVDATSGIPDETGVNLPCRIEARVQRIDSTLFALTFDARAGVIPTMSRRRVRLLVRSGALDPLTRAAVARPIAQWSLTDLY